MPASIITHGHFAQQVARFAVVPLLTRLASFSAHHFRTGFDSTPPVYPWTVAAIAHECLYAASTTTNIPSDADILALGRLHRDLHDAYLDEREDLSISMDELIDNLSVRYIYDQMPYRQKPYAEHERALRVFDRDYTHIEPGCELLSQQAWHAKLGVSIGTAIRSAQVIFEVTRRNSGLMDTAWLRRPDHRQLLERHGVHPDEAAHVFNSLFVRDLGELHDTTRRAGRSADEKMRRLDFNPWLGTPFARLPGGLCVAPSLVLVAQKLGVASLYHLGNGFWPRAAGHVGASPFTNDVGKAIECYVGELFAPVVGDNLFIGERDCSPHATGHKKRKRATKEAVDKTADWVLGLPAFTVVTEVKAAFAVRTAKLSFRSYLDEVTKKLKKALTKQIDKTANLIRGGSSVFPETLHPDTRGLIVTAEPLYMLNSPRYVELLPQPDCPTTILSLAELEDVLKVIARSGSFDLLDCITQLGNRNAAPQAIISRAMSDHGLTRD